jgi:hypothetical protein
LERAQRADSAGGAPNPLLPEGASACLDGGVLNHRPYLLLDFSSFERLM